MNLGDGLLFELENGKPRLILLSHGAEKNQAKQLPIRPRAANILSPRQPSCVEEVHGEERAARLQAGRHREARSKTGGAANTGTAVGRNTTVISSKTHEHQNGGGIKAVAKVKSDRHKHSSTSGSLRANGKTGQAQSSGTKAGGKTGPRDVLSGGDSGLKGNMVVLTNEQLQRILSTVQTSSNGQHTPEDHRTQGSKSTVNEGGGGGGGEMKEEDRGGGGEEMKKGESGGGVTDTTGSSQGKDSRSSGCLFSWLEERQSESRSAVDAKKAQWKRDLDEQVALKQQQQRSAPSRLQPEDDVESVISAQSSTGHREQPAAIRSSLKLGEVVPMVEVLGAERREEQRRRWLEELDRQREETTERRRRERQLQSQAEDHELWATHFDSLQRRPPLHSAAPPPAAPPPAPPPAAPSCTSERGEWEPSSSLSLVWEATSSCGAESVGGASVDTGSRYPSRASYLRTMTALLDPVQIEERERRRLKQLEQQRAIEAQMEERRQQREREEAKRREEEEAEERRVALEREMLQRQYELDTLRERQKEQPSHQPEQPKKSHDGEKSQEAEPGVTKQDECLEEEVSSVSPYRDTAVQTEDVPSVPPRAERAQTPDVSARYQPSQNGRNRAARTGKENVRLPGGRGGGGGGAGGGGGGGGGGDPYEAFARTDRRRDKRRPEWNTQRPSRRFVPASERYPAALQRNRQESRLKRQAELLALQERTCVSRADPPAPPAPAPPAPPLCSNPTHTRTSPHKKVETVSRPQSNSAAANNERGRSPPVPAVRLRVQGGQTSSSSSSPPPPPPPPDLEFIPYVRTDEVYSLDPLEPADTPPPPSHTDAPPQGSASPAPSHRDPLLHPELLRKTHTHRQQEILRGLAQLRQGLLQKQRELETDLKRHDNEPRSHSATHRM